MGHVTWVDLFVAITPQISAVPNLQFALNEHEGIPLRDQSKGAPSQGKSDRETLSLRQPDRSFEENCESGLHLRVIFIFYVTCKL